MPRISTAHLRVFFIASIALATALVSGCKPGNVEIETSYGVVAGIQDEHTAKFLGVPYAKPPVGDLRWADPQPPEPWAGVYQATQFKAACTQAQSPLLLVPISEDCLTLSIWTPTTPGPHPVMLWLHGGGNYAGAGSEPFTDGHALAQSQQVVVVAINHRLNKLGFFALPSINGSAPINGNQGIKDQIAALQWVHEEIARFGGDPNNVTVFGESSGAWNTCALLATPKTRTPARLLHKAIMQSGYCERFTIEDLATAQQHGAEFLAAQGCSDASDPLACARALPPQTGIQDAPPPLVIDGDVFPQNPFAVIGTSDQIGIPLLIGSNKDEGSRIVGSMNHPADEAGYIQLLAQEYPGEENTLATLYPLANYTNAGQAHSDIAGDQQVNCGALNMARHWSTVNDTWLYFFTHDVRSLYMSLLTPGWGTNPPAAGTFHTADVGYLFEMPLLVSLDRESDKAVLGIFQNAWGNFARTGNPNGGTARAWERFDVSRDNYLDINARPENPDGFRAGYCDYWIGRMQQ